MNNIGFDFDFPHEHLKPALAVSLLSVWVLVGLFHYLNRYTKRRYFTIWTAAWLFYALWLTLCMAVPDSFDSPLSRMLKEWCVGASAVFLLWGGIRFLKLETPQRLFGFFLVFLLVWSYIGAYHLGEALWGDLPIFSLIGLASGIIAWCFFRMRSRREYVGAGLLSMGFFLWALYLLSYPFLRRSDQLISSAFFISAVLQLFIAVSMIVLVLEEVRTTNETVFKQLRTSQDETTVLRSQVVKTEERYRRLFDQASEAIIIAATDDLRILEMNVTARRLLGLNGAEPPGLSLPAFCLAATPSDGTEKKGAEWFAFVCQKRLVNLVRRDGGATPAEVEGAPIQFEGVTAYQFFFRELTERARLEQQLRQSEKLSALGQMISGIAHELNNPLAVIKGYLELILARHELGGQTRADLQKVAQESNRAAELVSNFLSFAREQPVRRKMINVNDLIELVLEMRTLDLRIAGTSVALDLDAALPLTSADPDQMQQVLVNIIQNAMHAVSEMGHPGNIKISSRKKRGFIMIRIEDNGPGISNKALPHLFEPFFTTKVVGTGTGLGLSIAHSIITEHRGRIFHEPSALGGAAFVLELPIVTSTLPQIPTQPDPLEAQTLEKTTRTAEILILDDEVSIAELLGEMLSLLGYSATLSNSPRQALELLNSRTFDLILSDFRMPDMNGQQFYEAVAVLRPELARRIIFLTGDVVNEETQSFLESIGNAHLPKPFQLASVERAVIRVLEEKESAEASHTL